MDGQTSGWTGWIRQGLRAATLRPVRALPAGPGAWTMLLVVAAATAIVTGASRFEVNGPAVFDASSWLFSWAPDAFLIFGIWLILSWARGTTARESPVAAWYLLLTVARDSSQPLRRGNRCPGSARIHAPVVDGRQLDRLIAGTVALEDLPEIWNARMKEFLGVDVPSNTDGVLQDVHWSGGGIGYFPTYALGNVISLQIWAKVQEALPDLDDQMAAGDLLELSDWLRDNLYSWGRKLTPKETLGRLTGSDAIDPEPYLAYLGDKMAQLAR